MDEITLDGHELTAADVENAAHRRAIVRLSDDARARMAHSAERYATGGQRGVLRSKWRWLEGGGAGAQPGADNAESEPRAFVLSHCAGIGPALPSEEVRALIVVRTNAFAYGLSGVRPVLADRLLGLLSENRLPIVPSIGSVGAAGSIQLAHLARFALGYGGTALDGRPPPPLFDPTDKEALALINGSSYTTTLAALAVARAARLLTAAEAACALSFEVIRADLDALSPAAAFARGHEAIRATTERLRSLLQGSELVTSQRAPDSFSIRCAPAVLGTARAALDYVTTTVHGELNAPSDNPLVLPNGALVETGIFHAAPVALAMDHLKAAMAQVASIAERRIFRLTYGRLSGLPSFLVPGSGVNSGLMLAQYTAASLLAEMKALSMPASIDSIPTVQHQEDHVPMGPIAARSALDVLDRLADIVAIELLCAAQGLDYRIGGRALGPEGTLIDVEPQRPAAATASIYERVRGLVARWDDDQFLHPDLAALGAAVRAGVFSA